MKMNEGRGVSCDYCESIYRMTGRRHCPIHAEAGPPFATDEAKLIGERLALELKQKSRRRVDIGKRPIEESPLFGGGQEELF